MVLRDLLNNEDGKAYIVNGKNGVVRHVDCGIFTASEIEKHYGYGLWYHHNLDRHLVIFAKKLKNSRGYRQFIYFTGLTFDPTLICRGINLDKASYMHNGNLITTSKDDAYNYAKTILTNKIRKINLCLLKLNNNFEKLASTQKCYKTFSDLVGNEDGKAYVVGSNISSIIKEISCTIDSCGGIKEKYHSYPYPTPNNDEIIFVSLTRGTKTVTNLCNSWYSNYISINDNKLLNKKVMQFYKYRIFISLDDAYKHIYNQILERKKNIHNKITDLLKQKHQIT